MGRKKSLISITQSAQGTGTSDKNKVYGFNSLLRVDCKKKPLRVVLGKKAPMGWGGVVIRFLFWGGAGCLWWLISNGLGWVRGGSGPICRPTDAFLPQQSAPSPTGPAVALAIGVFLSSSPSPSAPEPAGTRPAGGDLTPQQQLRRPLPDDYSTPRYLSQPPNVPIALRRAAARGGHLRSILSAADRRHLPSLCLQCRFRSLERTRVRPAGRPWRPTSPA
jgi:hypothetical protein